MDLSLKKHKTDTSHEIEKPDTEEIMLVNGNSAAVFLPVPWPKMEDNSEELQQQIEQLEVSMERRMRFIENLRPHIMHLKEKYAAMDPNIPLIRRGTPEYSKLLGTVIEKVPSTKPLSDVGDAFIEGSVRGEPVQECEAGPYPKSLDPTRVQIGAKGTIISQKEFDSVPWFSASAATRFLLSVIFDAEILATNTLTGRPSRAFYGRERPPKGRLDENKVHDIIECVVSKCAKASVREIRQAITTKCSDAAKKKRLTQRRKMEEENNKSEDEDKTLVE